MPDERTRRSNSGCNLIHYPQGRLAPQAVYATIPGHHGEEKSQESRQEAQVQAAAGDETAQRRSNAHGGVAAAGGAGPAARSRVEGADRAIAKRRGLPGVRAAPVGGPSKRLPAA